LKVGKERATVTNYLRLLRLTPEARLAICEKQISMAHARALVAVEDSECQKKILKEIIKDQLSVRQTEALIKKYMADVKPAKTKVKIALSDNVMTFSRQLSERLNTKVSIKKDISGKGNISIRFKSNEELEQIIKSMS
jgi:ParB family chromosome partitioning protein